jgi:hypothetical protein
VRSHCIICPKHSLDDTADLGDTQLVPLTDSVWTATTAIRFVGAWFPHVMTVVKLTDGRVLLHSPCRPSPELIAGIATLGPVSDVVAPNWFHDLYLGEYRFAYPNATFWGPSFLQRQRKSLIDRRLDGSETPPWFAEFPYARLTGLLSFDECIFLHAASRTLVVADLLMNAVASNDAPLPTKLGYRFFGLDGRLRIFPILRWFGWSSRASLRSAAEHILQWNPERIVVGHGTPIERGATEQLQAAFGSLHLPI